jgi:hypothetical protein
LFQFDPQNFKISAWRKPTFSSVFPQLSFEPTFEKSKHFFSGNFFTSPWKIHILSLGSKLKKMLPQKFYIVLSFLLRKFEWILKCNLRGDRITDGKSQKNDGLLHILEKIEHLSTKTLPQKFWILIIQVMLKFRFI